MVAQQAQTVGYAFVDQYYYILHRSPGHVPNLYNNVSKLGCPEDDGSMSITTTLQAINEKILSLNYGHLRPKINTLDAQESFNGGVHVLVTGYLSGKGNTFRNFCQTFFPIPQYNGYFVLNNIFLYMGIFNVNPAVVSNVLRPITPELSPAPLQEIHASLRSSSSTDEAYGGEASTLYEIVDVPIVEEEIPKEEIRVAEFLMKYGKIFQMVVESSPQIEEVQKKSYASIATHLKESTANFSLPPHDPQKAPPKITEQVNTHLPPPTDAPFLVLLQLILGIIKMLQGTLGEGSNLGGVLDSEMRQRQDAELVAEVKVVEILMPGMSSHMEVVVGEE
ncbi:uncharacterized protein LOC111398683 [Olea europaea var. sylvestris]|uniref:uncharacterized protein LOC111398683 n=1 Tax=Olea europaea var. sylvestris TaxID=158386 RepID=UPI000C1D079F|nr:uncharacterized protein LOC111398683 [Olea europaea var. sylvestris]